MTWPTVAVDTTDTDSDTDSPLSARADLLDALQKLNQIIAHTSTFAATMLDDADAAAVRTTIGAQASDADLTALAALASTGIAVRSASNTWVQRSIAGTANQITATNGDGVSGNPTLSLPSAITLPGSLTTGGVLSLGATGQLQFPAAQNASADANCLDDYEEGTWTPGFSFGGGTTGIVYVSQLGDYVKIGRLVIATFRAEISNKGSSGGTARLTGLPFTSTASKSVGALNFSGIGTGVASVLAEVQASGTTAIFYGTPAFNAAASVMDNSFFNNAAYLQGTMIYTVST